MPRRALNAVLRADAVEKIDEMPDERTGIFRDLSVARLTFECDAAKSVVGIVHVAENTC